jgi:hypothetical protein
VAVRWIPCESHALSQAAARVAPLSGTFVLRSDRSGVTPYSLSTTSRSPARGFQSVRRPPVSDRLLCTRCVIVVAKEAQGPDHGLNTLGNRGDVG